jgi:peptidyl-prolyl cis-trans isomerase D
MGEPSFSIEYFKKEGSEFTPTHDELKAHYDENTLNFKDKEGKILPFDQATAAVTKAVQMKTARKEILKERLAYKKGEFQAQTATVSLTNSIIPKHIMMQVEKEASLDASKPLQTATGFVVVKVLSRIPAEPLPYEVAKHQVKSSLVKQKKVQELQALAQEKLKNFQGEIVSGVSKQSTVVLKDLTEPETSSFIEQLFGQKEATGFITLGEKVVAYKIMEQKLFVKNENSSNDEFVQSNTEKLKKSLIDNEIIKALQKQYVVEKFYN